MTTRSWTRLMAATIVAGVLPFATGCATCRIDTDPLTMAAGAMPASAEHEAVLDDLRRDLRALPGCPLRRPEPRLRCLLRQARQEPDCWRRAALLRAFRETVADNRGARLAEAAADRLIAGADGLLREIEPCVYDCGSLRLGDSYLLPEVFETTPRGAGTVIREFSLPRDGVFALRLVNGVAGLAPPTDEWPAAVPSPLPPAAVEEAAIRLAGTLLPASALADHRTELCMPVRLAAGRRTLALDLAAGRRGAALEVSVVGISEPPRPPAATVPDYRQCHRPEEGKGPIHGLFFLADSSSPDRERRRLPAAAADPAFFDPLKPSIVFVHGNQSWAMGARDRSLKEGTPWDPEPFPDMARFHKRGWNTAIFDWKAFAAEGWSWLLDARRSEAKVWRPDSEWGMRWRTCDVGGVRAHSHAGEPSQDVPSLLLKEYLELLGIYCPGLGGCEAGRIHLVGHSMGGQVIARFLHLLRARFPDAEVYAGLAPRVTLLDPGFAPGGTAVPQTVDEFLAETPVTLVHFIRPPSRSWGRAYSRISRRSHDLLLSEMWSDATAGHTAVVDWYFDEEIGPPAAGSRRTYQTIPHCDPVEIGPPPLSCDPLCFSLWLFRWMGPLLYLLQEGVGVAVQQEGDWCLERCEMPETPAASAWQAPACPARVTLFSDADFRGTSRALHRDEARLFDGEASDVGSVEVAAGCRATLYPGNGFTGEPRTLEADTADLSAYDHNVSSVRVGCD